jgi:multimeric flavodoxin WrbA
MHVTIICGSRNRSGQTAEAVQALARGLTRKGATAEQVYLPELRIERCRQCEDHGWGLCRKEGRCVIEDDFAAAVEKLRQADAVAFATPVYYSDLSESLRAFTDRLRRTCTHDAGRRSIRGKPAVGICVAGGGGGGAPACCVSLEKVLATIGFDVVDLLPLRRQNLRAKLPALEFAGEGLAGRPAS